MTAVILSCSLLSCTGGGGGGGGVFLLLVLLLPLLKMTYRYCSLSPQREAAP